MGTLRLRIDKHLEDALPRPPEVYARIFLLGESGAERESGRPSWNELIPVSHRKQDAKTIELEPGRYYVEVVLPSGEILADDVKVSDERASDLTFRPEYSPREWLSWQHLLGNVQTEQTERAHGAQVAGYIERPRDINTEMEAAGGGESESTTKRRARAAQDRRRRVRRSAGPVAQVPTWLYDVDTRRPIRCLSLNHHAHAEGESGFVWDWLASLSEAKPTALTKLLSRDTVSIEVTADATDYERAAFRLNSLRVPGGADSTRGSAERAPRCFAVVKRRQSAELVSLPIPWTVVSGGREADIEIVVQQPPRMRDFCSSASALDEQLGTILGYLSSGSLPTVRYIAETAQEMLYDKFENPFAAAAGAYALVGTARGANDSVWHGWVRTLMGEFPRIPDGAVQWGQLKLRMRRHSDDLEEARAAFKLAYRRGLPFYSMGVRWLLNGLEWAAHNDEEAADMLKHVRPLTLRMHYQQPFTVLRLGGDPGV